MTELWSEFLVELGEILGEDSDLDLKELGMVSGPDSAALAIVWHYPTRHTKKTNVRFGHVLVGAPVNSQWILWMTG